MPSCPCNAGGGGDNRSMFTTNLDSRFAPKANDSTFVQAGFLSGLAGLNLPAASVVAFLFGIGWIVYLAAAPKKKSGA